MDCDAPGTTTAGTNAAATVAASAHAQPAHAAAPSLAKAVGAFGSLDLLGALTAAGASGDFGQYMLDAGTGMEPEVAAFAVSFLLEKRHLVFFPFNLLVLFFGESNAETVPALLSRSYQLQDITTLVPASKLRLKLPPSRLAQVSE